MSGYKPLTPYPEMTYAQRLALKRQLMLDGGQHLGFGPTAIYRMPDIQMAYTAMTDVNEGEMVIETEWDKIRTNFAHFAADHAHAGGTADGADVSMHLITSTELSVAAANIEFTSIPATYKDLMLSVSVLPATDATALWMRFNGDTGSNYNWYLHDDATRTGAADSKIKLHNQSMGNDASYGGGWQIFLQDYLDSSLYQKVAWTGLSHSTVATPLIYMNAGGAAWLNTAAITQITFVMSSGNIAANSRISLYGIL